MAQFDENKVISPLHPEKAEVGKKYWISDELVDLKEDVEKEKTPYELKDVNKNSVYPFIIDTTKFQFLYPYEESPKQRMTRKQLAEWLAKGNGQVGYHQLNNPYVNTYLYYNDKMSNEEVDEFYRIRHWGSEEWIEPTVDIYERDCKKEN